LKIIAAIENPPVIVKILSHLGLPTRAPPPTALLALSSTERRPGTFRAPPDRSPAEPPDKTLGFSSTRKGIDTSPGPAIWLRS
jgi:hypothetical protein